MIKNILTTLLGAAFIALATPAAVAGPSGDFDNYRAGLYTGPAKAPDFSSLPNSSFFRTRIRNGAAEGVNFAGRVAMIEIGCGASCRNVYAADLKTGRIYSFPLAARAL